MITKRKRRKIHKMRGHRTMGTGDTKNHRGAGSRGGVGRAGSMKHQASKYEALFDRKGFTKVQPRIEKTINIEQVAQLVQNGSLGEAKAKEIVVDLKSQGFTKLLGKGIAYKTDKPLQIIVPQATTSAQEKAKASKWELIVDGPD